MSRIRAAEPFAIAGFNALLARERAAMRASVAVPLVVAAFALAHGLLGLYAGGFYQRGQADLIPFLAFHPWLLMLFAPALMMRSWADERARGTAELLLTLPVGAFAAVLAKWTAGVGVLLAALALALLPAWASVAWLGQPDPGQALAGAVGSALLGAQLLAAAGLVSALTRSSALAYAAAVVAGFVALAAGLPLLADVGGTVAEAVAALSPLVRFERMARGLVTSRDVVLLAAPTVALLAATAVVVEGWRERP